MYSVMDSSATPCYEKQLMKVRFMLYRWISGVRGRALNIWQTGVWFFAFSNKPAAARLFFLSFFFLLVGCSAWGKDISSVVDKEQRVIMSSI